jgi:hypothetical protein
VRIDGAALRHAMRIRGLTETEMARRSKELCVGTRRRGGVSQATISHALNDRRVHPATLVAINAVLRAIPPLHGVEDLVALDDDTVSEREPA